MTYHRATLKIFTFAAEIFVVPKKELAAPELFISEVIITQGLLEYV